MTGRLPWWTPHVVGLVLVHAAFWFVFWQLTPSMPVADRLWEATTGPAELMTKFVPGVTAVVVLAEVGLVIAAVRMPGNRFVLTVAAYGVVAVYWALAGIWWDALGAI